MANASSPTAANILSSLGVKGATAAGGSAANAGFVPVLGPDGKLDPSMVDTTGIVAQISVLPLSSVAFVDRNTLSDVSNGSIAAPFKTMAAAAAAGFNVIVLAAGDYSGESVSFARGGMATTEPICIVGMGECSISNTLSIGGIGTGNTITFHNVNALNNVSITGQVTAICTGTTFLASLTGSVNDQSDPLSPSMLSLRLGPSARVGTTNASSISCLADTSHVANVSTVVGTTATDALDRLGGRKIRVSNFSYGDSGLELDGTTDESAEEDSSGDFDLVDITGRDATLVAAINEGFVRQGGDARLGSVVADKASVGRAKVSESAYVVDSATSRLYRVGVENGRLVVEGPLADSADDFGDSADSGAD